MAAALPQLQTVATAYRFLPLEEAVEVTGHGIADLQRRMETGRILAVMMDDEILVAVTEDGKLVETTPAPSPEPEGGDINARLRQIRREDFAHLEGQPITVSEAARKYGVLSQTIHAWVKQGLVRVLDPGKGRGSRKTLDESDVAYLAKIHQIRKEYGVRSGTPLLDPNGDPNLIKHPTLSQYRHQRN